MGFFTSLLAWFQGLFFTKTAEISIVGLQASGKTSLVNVLTSGQWSEEVVPTVAFNLRKGKPVRKGNVTFKIWDVAGQPKFRNMWERYCRGVDAIVFMVDSSATDKLESAGFELHSLLDHQPLSGVPLLVLGNKNDLPDHASVDDLIRILTVRKGNVTFKIWDVAGQPKFRNMWERYCRGVDAIIFMVDSSATDKLESAGFELHSLLDHQPLSGVPLLVLGNKNDLPEHASVDELIRILRLETIRDRPVSCYSVIVIYSGSDPRSQPIVFDAQSAQSRYCYTVAIGAREMTSSFPRHIFGTVSPLCSLKCNCINTLLLMTITTIKPKII
ncbi:unnamed protein product [Rhizoctonia solani]|uniref:Uncharacterized protein n=1 Tax=Rhizoctonia solani TaxID=456999 RepID=A0A8H2WXD0_9AGAM|nr:unnamed protein product [Rhizoctonia solani]